MKTEAPAASVREDGGKLGTRGRDNEPTLPQTPSAVNSTSILLRSNIESALSGGISSLLICFSDIAKPRQASVSRGFYARGRWGYRKREAVERKEGVVLFLCGGSDWGERGFTRRIEAQGSADEGSPVSWEVRGQVRPRDVSVRLDKCTVWGNLFFVEVACL